MKDQSEKFLLEDSFNKKSHISFRNLARAINYIKSNTHIYGVERTLYDGLSLGFGCALSKSSR